jgi:hypothetical protein
VFRVGQEFEVQALFGTKLFVGIHAVEAYPQHDRIALGILGLIDLKVVGFARAARCLILGIEIQDDPLAR